MNTKKVLVVVFSILFIFTAAYGTYLTGYEKPPIDPAWVVEGDKDIAKGAVTVRWTGTSTLVISDGDSTIITDGWFSRPGIFTALFGKLSPDLEAIRFGLKQNQVTNADVVFAFHSHHDHAQDAPEVAKRTNAFLMGSPSTAMIGKGWGLSDNQMIVVEDRQIYPVGDFKLTPIITYHGPTPTEGGKVNKNYEKITEPLVPPVSIFDYKVGASYSLFIEHPKGSLMITSSSGYSQSALQGFTADYYLWGIGGFGGFEPEYQETYWKETIGLTQPHTVIPIHWDSLTGPIEGEFTGMMRLMTKVIGGSSEPDLIPAFINKKAQEQGVKVVTLPRYDEVVLFD
jgi:L-ascorbate metabolism protein UlaG (beta-lactamase superfamily)